MAAGVVVAVVVRVVVNELPLLPPPHAQHASSGPTPFTWRFVVDIVCPRK